MHNLRRHTLAPAPQPNHTRIRLGRFFEWRRLAQFAAIVLILIIYSYPALRTRAELGANRGMASLPPEFSPDLSLYLNLSSVRTVRPGQVLNPYYMVPVPANGTAYLKFRLGAYLFGGWDKLFDGRMWPAMFFWNLGWWALLCGVTLWLFARFLPIDSAEIGIAGLGLLTLVNIGMVKPLLAAWMQLPSLAGFQSDALELPFMRAFTPQIPMPMLLAYLGLQMSALRKKSLYCWAGMGILQLLALSTFPYATLMMAGLTLVSVVWWLSSEERRSGWYIPLIYGAACAIADGAFLMRGSMNIYASHASPIHFQASLLPHLVGGTWLLLCILTGAAVFSKSLPGEVKWPLVGLGATNAALMLGDAVVPSTVLLLSHHAAYFAHTTAAVLVTFLAAAALVRVGGGSNKVRIGIGLGMGVLALNGIFLAVGGCRSFLPLNRQQEGVARLLSTWQPANGDLFIARSRQVDDACGWAALITATPVLFCTDAEVMLTPQQNQEIHRFRQALYLYFCGENSGGLKRILRDPDPTKALYQLGYWAEAISWSGEEKNEGLRGVESDLLPFLEGVERRDAAAGKFLRQFRRVILIDDLQYPAFVPARVGSFLRLDREQRVDNWEMRYYTPE